MTTSPVAREPKEYGQKYSVKRAREYKPKNYSKYVKPKLSERASQYMPDDDCCTPSVGVEGEVNSAKMHTTRTRDHKRTKMSYSKSMASTDQLLRHYKTSSKNFQSTASDRRSEKKSSGRITPHEKRGAKSAKKKYFQKPSGRLSTQTYEQRQKLVRELLRRPAQ